MYLLNYAGERKDIDVDLTDDKYIEAYICVISGDELLYLIDENDEMSVIDSDDSRAIDYFDTTYCLKEDGKLNNIYDSKEFNNRSSSYWDWWEVYSR